MSSPAINFADSYTFTVQGRFIHPIDITEPLQLNYHCQMGKLKLDFS